MKLKMSMLAIGIFALLSTSLYIPTASADEEETTLFFDGFTGNELNGNWYTNVTDDTGDSFPNTFQIINDPRESGNEVLDVNVSRSYGAQFGIGDENRAFQPDMFNASIVKISFDYRGYARGAGRYSWVSINLQNNMDNLSNTEPSYYNTYTGYNSSFRINIDGFGFVNISRLVKVNSNYYQITEPTGIRLNTYNVFLTFEYIRDETKHTMALTIKTRDEGSILYSKEWSGNDFFTNGSVIFDSVVGDGQVMFDNVDIVSLMSWELKEKELKDRTVVFSDRFSEPDLESTWWTTPYPDEYFHVENGELIIPTNITRLISIESECYGGCSESDRGQAYYTNFNSAIIEEKVDVAFEQGKSRISLYLLGVTPENTYYPQDTLCLSFQSDGQVISEIDYYTGHDANENFISENTGLHLSGSTFYTVTLTKNAIERSINLKISETSTGEELYSKTWTGNKYFFIYEGDNPLQNLSTELSIGVDGDNESEAYIDNIEITDILPKENKTETPPEPNTTPYHTLKNRLGNVGMSIVFISLIPLLFVAFILKHPVSIILVGISAFLLFSLFILPLFGINDKAPNILISGAISLTLIWLKSYTIRDEMRGLFENKNLSIYLISGGIVVVTMALFWV